MKVTCTHCGKNYSVDTHKLPQGSSKAKCAGCGEWIFITHPDAAAPVEDPFDGGLTLPDSPQDFGGDGFETDPFEADPFEADDFDNTGAFAGSPGDSDFETGMDFSDMPSAEASEPATEPAKESSASPATPRSRKKGSGITTKFLLFSILPFIIICGLSFSYFRYFVMPKMDDQVTGTVSDAIWSIEQKHLHQQALTTARQVRQYLFSHPDLMSRDFNRDIYFKKTAVRKMGTSGYTFLYELPGPDQVWRFWAHANPRLAGKDITTLKSSQADFQAYWKILTSAKSKRPAPGFYDWKDKDGVSQWYMTTARVRGTPYVVGVTSKASEIDAKVAEVRTTTQAVITDAMQWTLTVMGLGALLAALIFIFYGRRIARRIVHLADVADRISLGEVDIEVDGGAKDEIGELGEAISRLRDSIKVAMAHLKRR
ncbi:MAG: zinc-ribbon domain-containing protein [Desulfobacter sp.]|nr:MAG: zinc-ribbon domain-containing protein [Desulfobacter sp.]